MFKKITKKNAFLATIFVAISFILISFGLTQKKDYFSEIGSQESVGCPTHPQGIYFNGKTYLVFQGTDFSPYAASYNHKSKSWQKITEIGKNPLTDDAHGTPSLLIDQNGYLHVFYGAHGEVLKHSRSVNSEDASLWVEQPDAAPKATYPQPILMPNGTLYLFYRAGGHLDPWVYKISGNNGKSWSEEIKILQGNPDDWYLFAQKGKNGTIHAVFYWLDDLFTLESEGWRYNIYYMFLDENGKWKSKQGDILNFPLSKKSADAYCLVFNSEIHNSHTNHARIAIDNKNNPYIIFNSGKGTGENSHTFKFAKWDNNSWKISDIAQTDCWWDGATLVVLPSSEIEAYITARGTAGLGENAALDETDRGGNIEKWISKNSGESWVKNQTIISKSDTGNVYNYPHLVENYHPDAKIIFAEWITDLSKFNAKTYLWGDKGFIKK